MKLFERFKGAVCLVPLDDIYLGAQVARIKLKGGGKVGQIVANSKALSIKGSKVF